MFANNLNHCSRSSNSGVTRKKFKGGTIVNGGMMGAQVMTLYDHTVSSHDSKFLLYRQCKIAGFAAAFQKIDRLYNKSTLSIYMVSHECPVACKQFTGPISRRPKQKIEQKNSDTFFRLRFLNPFPLKSKIFYFYRMCNWFYKNIFCFCCIILNTFGEQNRTDQIQAKKNQ